jgi:hypothetical protein
MMTIEKARARQLDQIPEDAGLDERESDGGRLGFVESMSFGVT